MKYYVAVYGTLKKGFSNHYLLKNAPLVSKEHTGRGYSLFVEGLPYLVSDLEGGGCEIEIYEINEIILSILDILEGHPNFYERKVLKNLEQGPVWVYLYPRREDFFSLEALSSYEGINSKMLVQNN